MTAATRLLALALIASGVGWAVAPEADAQPVYRFDHFGTDVGLSQSTVTAIAQDHQGFLWVGTDDGLNRFDGRTFVVYRHALEDPTTLPGSRITSLYVEPSGTLWVGTMSGLARFDRRTETFHVPPGAPGDPNSRCAEDVTSLAPAPAGGLWAGTFSGSLCLLSADRQTARRVSVTTRIGKTVDRVYTLRLDASGVPWAQVSALTSDPSRVCRTDESTVACDFLGDGAFTRPVPGSDALFATGVLPSVSIFRQRPDGRREPLALTAWPSGIFARTQDLVAISKEDIWMGTEEQGILSARPSTGEMHSILPDADDPGSLASATIRALFKDRQGIVWIGTAQGLDRWQPPSPGRFRVAGRGAPASGGLSDARVNGIAETRDGAVWVGTRDGLNRIDPETGRVEVIRRPDAATYANAFWYLYEDSRGTLWVGSKRIGLWRLEPGSRQLTRERFYDGNDPEADADRAQVRHINEDSQGRLWIGLGTGYAVRTPDGRWYAPLLGTPEPSARPSALPSSRVNVFYEDRQKRLWVGTDAGLCRLAPEARVPDNLRYTCYYQASGDPTTLGADVVWAITEDGEGRLWIGTVGGGLARYVPETDSFVRLTTRDGLPNNTVYGLVTDRTGALWATTNAGLARIEPASGAVSVYTTADGLPGDEFDFMAYALGRDGTVYVGGPSGLVAFDPEMMAASGAPPRAVITGASIFDRPLPGLFASGDTLRLRHDENFFRLGFTALDLRTPERTRYRYRLADFESEWRHASGATPEASYTGIPPGHYTFEVMASGADGSFSGEPTVLHVVLVPALWQTAAFRGSLILLALLASGFTFASIQRRREARREREESDAAELKRRVSEAHDRERLRLARELHDGPVQDLYRLGHDLDRLRIRSGEVPPGPTTLLESRAQVTTVATNLREVLATLRPPIIPHLGLGAALEALARRWRRRQPSLDVHLRIDDAAARALAPEAQNALYRVVQEALTNVSRHAGVDAVTVTLRFASGGAEMSVADAGRGFERPTQLLDLARADHFGLVGASERLDVLGGRLAVETAPEEGTTVRAWVPVLLGSDDPA